MAATIEGRSATKRSSIAPRSRFFGCLIVALSGLLPTLPLAAQQTVDAAQHVEFLPALTDPAATSALLPDSPLPVSQQTSPVEPSQGAIDGRVTDPDGSVYEGVQVTLTQTLEGTTIRRTIVSDGDGHYLFSNALPGPFTLAFSSNGFATKTISGLLHPKENYQAPVVVLMLARTTSDVQVNASLEDVAEAQIKDEEKQRVFAIIPNFYVSYAPNAAPLTSKQKFELAWKSSIDPVTFLQVGALAGFEQAEGDFKGYGQGTEGYAKRYGAAYADNFIGGMIGGAILPSIFKQDPRYFYKGTGTIRSRALYAIANAVICKGDNGHWQVDYSAIIGGLAAAGISNVYYPASDRNGAALTFENALLGTAGSAVGNLFQEFLVRKLTPKIPKRTSTTP